MAHHQAAPICLRGKLPSYRGTGPFPHLASLARFEERGHGAAQGGQTEDENEGRTQRLALLR